MTSAGFWRWMPGMDIGDALVVSVDDRGAITEVVFDGRLVSAGEGAMFGYDTTGARPNADDAATLGCLLALWWEAWPAECGDRARRCAEIQDAIVDIERDKLALAFVAALEAAP